MCLWYSRPVRLKGSTALPRVLSSVANAAIAISSANASTSGGVYRAFRKFDELQSLSDRQLQGTVRHAIRGSYIVIRTIGGKRHIELTKKGRRSVQKSALERLRPLRQESWDGKWRIILFDVPESSRKGRNSFAAGLKRMGFAQIQKSCFAFPFPCLDEIEALADFCEVRPFIKLIVAERMEGSKQLAARFKLP